MASNASLLEAVVHAGEAERARMQREDAIAAQRLKAQVWRDETVESIESAKAALRATQKPFASPKWRKMRYQEIDTESAAEWIHFLVLNNREQEAKGYIEQFVDTARRGVQDKLKQEQEAAEEEAAQAAADARWDAWQAQNRIAFAAWETAENERRKGLTLMDPAERARLNALGARLDEYGEVMEPEGGLVSCGVGRFHPNADVIAREKPTKTKAKAAAEAEEKGEGAKERSKENREVEEEESIEILEGVAIADDGDEPYDPYKIFTVECILKDKTVKGQKRYLVKWVGYDASHNSWEPPESFFDDSPITIYETNKPPKEKKRKAIVAQPKTQEDADAAFARELHEQDRRVRKKPTRLEPQFGKSNVPIKYI